MTNGETRELALLMAIIRTVIYVDGSTRRELSFADVRDQAKAFGIGLKSFWRWRKGDVLATFRYVLSQARAHSY